MAFTPPPQIQLRNHLIDTAPLGRGVDAISNALQQRRERENMAALGQAAQRGGLSALEDTAYGQGKIGLGLQAGNALAQQASRTAAAQRADAEAAESRRRFELTHGLQKQRFAQQSRRNDPNEVFKVRAQQARQYNLDPKTPEGRQYVLTGQLSQKTKHNIFQQRDEVAVSLGIQRGTPEHKHIVLTGKIPATTDASKTANIASGINQLAKVPGDYGSDQLERATGPLQGGDTYVLSPMARAFGSLANGIWGGANSTTEIRSRIAGDVEALSATIKPLIRKPGEGPWTDADQRRLVSVVGDLAQARSTEEYKRALENVRQRIMANFGVELPQISFGGGQQQGAGQLPPGVTVRRIK